MIKNLLSSLGLGQPDLIHVFSQTIQRLEKRELTNPDRRLGQAQAIETMVEVLRDEDVMNSDTLKAIREQLDNWLRKGPKKPRS